MPGKKLVDPHEQPKHRPSESPEPPTTRPGAEEPQRDEEGVPRRADDDMPDDDVSDDDDDDEGIDVWPTADLLEEEAQNAPVEESGLSVDPEDLGKAWLNQATEQNNFESSRDESDSGMHIINVHTKT